MAEEDGKKLTGTQELQTPESELLGSHLPSHFFPEMRTFFINVFKDSYVPMSQSSIGSMVGHICNPNPLTVLSPEEEQALKEDLRNHFEFDFNGGKWQIFSKKDLVFLPAGERHVLYKTDTGNFWARFLSGPMAQAASRKFGLKPLSASEKEQLITDPNIFLRASYVYNDANNSLISSPFGPGVRHLFGRDSYDFTEESLKKFLSNIRFGQNKAPQAILTGLDIGGGNGLAASEIESLDHNTVVTCTTINVATGIYPLRGGHTFIMAERFPQDFYEKFDFIISNYAFRYFRYHDLAIKNTFLALKPGGIIRLDFSYDSSKEEDLDEVQRRVKNAFSWINHLENQGILEYLPFMDDDDDIYRGQARGEIIAPGGLCIKKVKSINSSQ